MSPRSWSDLLGAEEHSTGLQRHQHVLSLFSSPCGLTWALDHPPHPPPPAWRFW